MYASSKASVLRLTAETIRRTELAIEVQNGKAETGGLLVGKAKANRAFAVSATIPENLFNGSLTEFVLNGDEHGKQAEALVAEYDSRIKVIGVWHTHICDAEFSELDRRSHRILAEVLYGAVSLLIVTEGEGRTYKAAMITQDGEETPCVVEIMKK